MTFLKSVFVFLLFLMSILEIFSDSVFIYGKEKYLVVVIACLWPLCNIRCSVISLRVRVLSFVWFVVTSVLFKHIPLLFSVILLICLLLCLNNVQINIRRYPFINDKSISYLWMAYVSLCAWLSVFCDFDFVVVWAAPWVMIVFLNFVFFHHLVFTLPLGWWSNKSCKYRSEKSDFSRSIVNTKRGWK